MFLPATVTPAMLDAVRTARDDEDFAGRLHLTLDVQGRAADFVELARRGAVVGAGQRFEVGSLLRLRSHDPARAVHRAASFLVDSDEPAVVAAFEQVRREGGRPPDPAGLEAFVSAYISTKTHTRAFDVASQVAASRSGDCTEHAVLLAALLRRAGVPARVVVGLAVVGMSEGVLAVGHAWVEAHEAGAWRVRDAALFADRRPGRHAGSSADATLRRAYLPVQVIVNEGPGFYGAMMRAAGVMQIERVIIDATPEG